jgi:hypothetical protein
MADRARTPRHGNAVRGAGTEDGDLHPSPSLVKVKIGLTEYGSKSEREKQGRRMRAKKARKDMFVSIYFYL